MPEDNSTLIKATQKGGGPAAQLIDDAEEFVGDVVKTIKNIGNKKKLTTVLRKGRSVSIGSINLTPTSKIISIFDFEHFNLGTCLTPTHPYPSANASAKTTTYNKTICAIDTSYNDADLGKISETLGPNIQPEKQDIDSYVYKTRREFEKLYLSDSNEDELKKDEKKIMVKLFLFIFSDEPVKKMLGPFSRYSEDLPEDMAILMRSHLTPFDKIPCKENNKTIWTLFKRCISFRIKKLNNEIGSLQKILPKGNFEYLKKQTLRVQLLRLIHVLDEKNRTCMTFSNQSGNLNIDAVTIGLLKLIKEAVQKAFNENPNMTRDEQIKQMDELIGKVKVLQYATPSKGETNEKIYEGMIEFIKGHFDKLTKIDKDLDDLDDTLQTLKPLPLQMKGGSRVYENVQKFFPQQKSARAAEGSNADAEGSNTDADVTGLEESEEEYDRVFTTAMTHLDLIKSSDVRKELLDAVCEILGGSDIESSIEMAVTKKGFSLSATVKQFEGIEVESKHKKSFLRCIETLLEIRDTQMKAYTPTPDSVKPGADRYLFTLSKYPSLQKYIPTDFITMSKKQFKKEAIQVKKTLHHIYPYTDTLFEDIHILREQPDPCCLFYKTMLLKRSMTGPSVKKIRMSCKKVVDAIPNCKKILEEVIEEVSVKYVSQPKGDLLFKEITLPKGYSTLAECIRTHIKAVTMLPISIHEKGSNEVLGDSPFLLIGEDDETTVIHGVRNYAIDVTGELKEIRKDEIGIGEIMFLYLYIKCDGHIDD